MLDLSRKKVVTIIRWLTQSNSHP